ncbi:MAG TPA: hypothetical protein VGM39_03660 [Kofleriaceae bacterium]
MTVPEIHVQVRLADNFPSQEELAVRAKLFEALAGVGTPTGRGAGGGAMDLWYDVDDGPSGMRAIAAAVEQLGLTARTSIRQIPPTIWVVFPESHKLRWDLFDEVVAIVEQREVGTWRGTSMTDEGGYEVSFHVADLVIARLSIENILEEMGVDNVATLETRG